MKYDPRHVTLQECRFMQLYALALKKNYSEFDSALQLMRAEAGVSCVVRAAILARQLQRLHSEFDHELALLANQHGARSCELPPYPSAGMLIRLLQVSFFKLVDVQPDKHSAINDKGWYSGHPVYWEDALKQSDFAAGAPGSSVSLVMHAFLKLLSDIFGASHYVPGNPLKSVSFDAAPDDEEDANFEDDEPEDDNPDYGTDY